MTRVLVAAEVGFYRDGLAYVLPQHGIEVVGVAATAREAVTRTALLAPEVTLLDMTMTRSIEVVRTIARVAPDVKVLALSVREREPEVIACVEAGVVGYVTRDASLEDVIDSIRRAVRGEPLAAPHIVAILMRRVATLASHSVAAASVSPLTSREFEVIELIDEGLSNKEIAARLCIEVATVKNHVHNILEKLSVSRRGEAAARVRASGWRDAANARARISAIAS